MQATGKKSHTTAVQKDAAPNLDMDQVGRGILLMGSLGLEEYKSGSACVNEKHKKGEQLVGQASVGFGNVSKLGMRLKQQADSTSATEP